MMRWTLKTKPPLQEGDVRIKSEFLLLPKCIDNEWRWLERACWHQVVSMIIPTNIAAFYSPGQRVAEWRDINWGN